MFGEQERPCTRGLYDKRVQGQLNRFQLEEVKRSKEKGVVAVLPARPTKKMKGGNFEAQQTVWVRSLELRLLAWLTCAS